MLATAADWMMAPQAGVFQFTLHADEWGHQYGRSTISGFARFGCRGY
jgi:hypothetical protein